MRGATYNFSSLVKTSTKNSEQNTFVQVIELIKFGELMELIL